MAGSRSAIQAWRALARLAERHALTLERAFVVAVLLWTSMRTWDLFDTAWTFTTDDAYITLRYAKNLAAGHGPAWNAGEPPVEGYSNFSFVLAGAAAIRLGYDPIWTVKLAGAVGIMASIPLLYWVSRSWVRPAMAVLAPVAFSAHPGAIWWGVSGLETGVFVAGVLLAFAFLLQGLGLGPTPDGRNEATTRAFVIRVPWLVCAGVVLGLMGMTRPETPLVAGAFVASVVAHVWRATKADGSEEQRAEILRRGRRAVLWLGGSFALIWGSYFVARWIYFGRMLPNTVYCKQGYEEEPHKLLWRYWDSSAVFALMSLAYPWRRLGARHVVLLGVPLLYVFTLSGVDPIVAYYDRLFLPAHAFVTVGAVVAMPHLLQLVMGSWLPRARGFLPVLLMLGHHGELERPVVGEYAEEFLPLYEARMRNRENLAMWLDARLSPDQALVIGDAGVIPFLTNARVLDAFCLNSNVTTRAPIDRDPARWVEWMYAQAPETIVVHSRFRTKLRPRDEYGVYPLVVVHPDFHRHYTQQNVFPAKRFSYYVYGRNVDAPGPRDIDLEIAATLPGLAAAAEAEAAADAANPPPAPAASAVAPVTGTPVVSPPSGSGDDASG